MSGGRVVATAGSIGRRLAVSLAARSVIVLVAWRDGVTRKRHLAGRQMAGLIRMRSRRRRLLRVAARDRAVVVVDRAVSRTLRLAGRRRSAIRHRRQAGAATEGRSGRVGKGRDGILSRGERGRVERLRRV